MTKNTKPYLPVASFEDIVNYVPGQEDTYIKSAIVNAVAEALYETKYIESKEIATYLELDPKKLAYAVQIDTGIKLIDIIHEYRICQIEKYRKEHPDDLLDTVAKACGYACDSTLWRLYQRKYGKTVTGKKSNAGPERFNEMMKARRSRVKSRQSKQNYI